MTFILFSVVHSTETLTASRDFFMILRQLFAFAIAIIADLTTSRDI